MPRRVVGPRKSESRDLVSYSPWETDARGTCPQNYFGFAI